jgi:hypothetical protein
MVEISLWHLRAVGHGCKTALRTQAIGSIGAGIAPVRYAPVMSRSIPTTSLLLSVATGVLMGGANAASVRAAPPAEAPPHYLAIGGGATPESTEISLEQNLDLARQVLRGPGALLFAGGRGSISVRTLSAPPPADSLLVRLGDLFHPRQGRHSEYRATALEARDASLESVEAAFREALGRGAKEIRPLLLFISAHGQQADEPRDNGVVLWGGQSWSAAQLAALHEQRPRPLRVVAASCYSGGFAELSFQGAEERLGPARAPRCGLFAGTWDRETSGCDPDPDRRSQQGYSLHVLQALRGRDRDGNPVPLASLDLDGDHQVSLLEAHTRASVAANSIDVPTTTSERYLRHVQKTRAAPDYSLVPEHAKVIEALGKKLGLAGEAQVNERWAALDRRLSELALRVERAEDGVQAAYAVLSGRLLARWPMLDDAYHPGFAAALERDREPIARALTSTAEAQRYEQAQRALERVDLEYQGVEVDEALVTRLKRAHETAGLATALRTRGGPYFAYYQQLLGCERWVP